MPLRLHRNRLVKADGVSSATHPYEAADLLEECGEQIVPVFPQTTPGVAAFVAAPTWFAEERFTTDEWANRKGIADFDQHEEEHPESEEDFSPDPDDAEAPPRLPPLRVTDQSPSFSLCQCQAILNSLVPVPYQPMAECVFFLATTRWPKMSVEVLMDCRQLTGLVFTVSIPPLATAALLSEHAGVAWWRAAAVWVEPFSRPLQASDVARLQPGSLVVFQSPDGAPPDPGDLSTMLRTATGWDRDVTLPFHFDPSIFILSDEGSFRYAMGGARLQRSALASLLEYDPGVTVFEEGPVQSFLTKDRSVFLGVTWRIVWDGMFPLNQYVAEHVNRCPTGFQVDVQGAFPIAGGDFLSVSDGTTLVVSYVFSQPTRPGTSSSGSDRGRSSVDSLMSGSEDEGGSDSSDGTQDLPLNKPLPRSVQPPDSWVLRGLTCLRVSMPSMLVNFIVLKPEYVKETAALSLTLPCTLGEAIDTLQAARTTEDFIRFPHLWAVNPQSVSGHAVFVAGPRWHPTALIICVNTTAIDGRLFAAYTGDYADYEALCWHADLPPGAGYQVYVGDDDQPLPPYIRVHLVDGMQATFVPDNAGSTLPLLLTRSEPWQAPCELPEPDIRDAYLLVSRDDHVLHIEDFGRPFRFRENIAARAGLGSQAFHILPADPPVRNVAIAGITCRTILAACVCSSGVDRCRGTFFDLRPIQEGIRFVCRDDPAVDLDSLKEAMADSVPMGWAAQFRYEEADAAQEVAYDAVGSDDASQHGGRQNDDGRSHGHGRSRAAGDPGSSQNGDRQPGDEVPDDPPTLAPATGVGGGLTPLHFLLYSPEYKPEGLAPGLTPPMLFSAIIEHLLRAAEDHRRSPRLIPVHPQPQRHPAALLALPFWPTETVAVLFDCHENPRRVFAACVPRYFVRDDAVFMAQVDPTGGFDVYHRDIPWAIPDGYWIYPEEGDLIAFYPAGAAQDPAVGFHQLLQGEARAGPLPQDLWDSAITWVLSDGSHVAVPIPEDQFALNSAQAAAALDLRPGHFLLVPTTPEIVDHARNGTPSRRALIAAQTEGERDVDVRHRIPYVLDLRPIHLYLSSAFAPDGVVDLWLSLAPLLGLVVPVLVMLALVAPGILLVVAVNTRGSDISGGSPLLPDAIADGRETVTPIFPDHVQAMLILVDLCRLLWVHQCALRIACVSQLCEDKPGCITRPAFAATGGVLPRHELDSAGIVAAPCARDFGTAGAVPRTAAHGTVKHRTGWLLGLVLLSQFQRGWGAPDTSLTGPLGSHVIGLPHFVPAVQKCSLQPVCDYATEGVRLRHCLLCSLSTSRPTIVVLAAPRAGRDVLSLSLCAAIGLPPPDNAPRDVVVLAGLHWQPLALAAPPQRDFGGRSGPVLLGGLRMSFSYQDLRALLDTVCQPAAMHQVIRLAPAADTSKIFDTEAHATGLTDARLHCFTDGSFTASMRDSHAKLGWACVFVDPVNQRIGLLSGRRPMWLPEDSDPPSAFVAECLALEAALRVCGTALWNVPVVIRSDCFSAVEIAAGRARSSDSGVAGLLRHAGSFGRTATRYPPVIEHVRGHAGCLFNEIADVAAKLAANGHDLGVLASPAEAGTFWWSHHGRALDWAGLVCQCAATHPCLPKLGTNAPSCHSNAGLTPLQCIEPFLPFVSSETGDERRTGSLRLRLATYNVLSLCGKAFHDNNTAGLAFAPARPAILAAALHACGVSVAGIQEARTAEGRLTTEGFLRICSGAVKGQFGVELWFKVNCPVVASDATDSALAAFEPSALTVLHADPRRLLVLFSAADVRLLFVSLHAPHRGAESHILDSWWLTTRQLLERHASRGLVFLMGDCNASVGSVTSCAVGDHAADTQDVAGDHLHDILQRLSAWLPATFSSVHDGPSGAYVQKRNQAESRIDFVAIPGILARSQVWSWVEPSIHAGQPIIDHLAALVSVCARIVTSHGKHVVKRPRINASLLRTPEGQACATKLFASAPQVPWEVGPDAHAALVVAHLQKGLQEVAAKKGSQPKHPYLTGETWTLQRHVAGLRRRLYRIKVATRAQELAAAFAALRLGHGRPLRVYRVSAWVQSAGDAVAQVGQALQSASKQLRAGCKADRAVYLSSLADSVSGGGLSAHEDLRRLLCMRKRKPFAPEVLPQLLDEQGELCGDHESTLARWRRHFSRLEAGIVLEPQSVAGLCPPVPFCSDVPAADFPTPADLLGAILHTKAGKACGPDGIPAELGQADPVAFQSLLWPLLLKVGMMCREPLGFKSGILTWLYKGKGSKVECDSYRAIMLLSVLAKTLHRAFRPALYTFFQQTALPTQMGGKKSTTVLFGSHISRAYGVWCASQKTSTIILFADVSAAYYSAVRSLTARRDEKPTRDQTLPPDPDVQEQMAAPSALSKGGATDWLQALTHDFNDRTWMTLAGDSTQVQTTRGSRPGSSWADLFFGVTVPGILSLRDTMHTAAPRPRTRVTIPWDGWKGFFDPPRGNCPDATSVDLDDVVWADDLASYLRIADPAEAATRLGFEASVLNDSFRGFGYSLSFGANKTAAVVHLRGPGAKAARRALFSNTSGLAVLSEAGPAQRLPLVPEYRHLGVRIAANNSLLPEIRMRVAAAWTAFRQGKTKVFRSKRISLARKGAILGSHVLSRLTFGSGAWSQLKQGEMTLFSRTVISMYRQCLGLAHADDQHVSTATICALIGQADPGTILHTERLRYARQLVCNGPEALWALVRGDNAYLSSVRDAFRWLLTWVRATCALPDPSGDWGPWADTMCNRPGLFRGLVKRARALEVVRISCFASLQALLRTLEQTGGARAAAVRADGERPDRYTEVCIAVHPQMPPLRVAGTVNGGDGHGATRTHPGLVDALLALDDPDSDAVWQTLLDFAEPLDVLKQSLQVWATHPDAVPTAAELAEDIRLMLDPELWCDDFRKGKGRAQSFLACVDLQRPTDCSLDFVLSGAACHFRIDDPPLPEFVFPFRHSIPLTAARRHLAWLEHACDTFGAFLSATQLSPVSLMASHQLAQGAGLVRRVGPLRPIPRLPGAAGAAAARLSAWEKDDGSESALQQPMQDVVVLHAKTLNLQCISCRDLLSRGPELAEHLGYQFVGIKKGSHAALGQSLEARAHGGGVPSMMRGGVTASLQSIGASGIIKPEAKHAIAAALQRARLISDRDYLAAITGRPQMVVVSIPSYFSSPQPDIPLLMNDYRENGHNHRMAEQMLKETHLKHGLQLCRCHCREHDGCCRMEVEKVQRIENKALFERFKVYEAAVAEDLRQRPVNDLEEVLVRGIHPWLQRLGCRNGLCKAANTVYLLHGTRQHNLDSVLKHGLRTKFSLHKTPDGLYGRGLYFANNSCKAFQYAGHGGCIIVCRVVLGSIERHRIVDPVIDAAFNHGELQFPILEIWHVLRTKRYNGLCRRPPEYTVIVSSANAGLSVAGQHQALLKLTSGREVLVDLSSVGLDEFQQVFTSEDNASFEAVLEKDRQRRREKEWWVEGPELKHNTKCKEQALDFDKVEVVNRPGTIMTCEFQARNTLYFKPKGELSAAPDKPAIECRNTRFTSQEQSDLDETLMAAIAAKHARENGLQLADILAKMLKDGTFSVAALHNYGQLRAVGGRLETPINQRNPQAGNFNFVSTPAMAPGDNGVSPFMTFGKIASTPRLLEEEIGPSFRVAEESPRDRAAEKLARGAMQRQRESKQNSKKERLKALGLTPNASPASVRTTPASVASKVTPMTPIGQLLHRAQRMAQRGGRLRIGASRPPTEEREAKRPRTNS
ncbi:ESS2, partial [Symbiodinium sp. KB8]